MLADLLEKGPAGKHFPLAIARLEAWEAELRTGHPSAAEVEAFHRYASLISSANIMRGGPVTDAADMAVSAFKDAGDSERAAAAAAVAALTPGVGHGSALGEMTKGAAGSVDDFAKDAITSKVEDAITSGAPAAIVDTYSASADVMLAHLADGAQSVTALHAAPMQDLVGNSVQILNDGVDGQMWQGIAADSTHMITGDGSFGQSVAVGALDAIPGYGRAFSGLQAVADQFHANVDLQIGFASTNIALVGSMQNLLIEAKEMGIAN